MVQRMDVECMMYGTRPLRTPIPIPIAPPSLPLIESDPAQAFLLHHLTAVLAGSGIAGISIGLDLRA